MTLTLLDELLDEGIEPEVQEVATKAPAVWGGPIPEKVRTWIETAIKDGERHKLPVQGSNVLRDQLDSVLRAALKESRPDLELYPNRISDDEGTITHYTYKVGPKRINRPGRKKAQPTESE